ncbi:hypothetical protein [Arthrobacter sunyaminii]|uniref:Uncharacterized protein n=1 Tax=Arthrobacter sunyaminii TaxID=2816859 RepID=A0A975XLW8_9MICC|nr:hypothetical protein [Arthrobacter sunyaminii]MBO0908391.1 hypothetical protein [Arthrobacter sunyaminii]QWQ37371.1 hypothetical protein KG104_06400 [Arthrobacter sunyaminii]
MSADSVAVPGAGRPVAAFSNDQAGFDAVDVYEITARLESSGVTDRTARRWHGARDVFDYAQSLVQVRTVIRSAGNQESWVSRDALFEAVRRGIVLILGAFLGGLTATVMAASTREVLIAGIGAWIIGQSISGIVWAQAGAGQVNRGVARGTGATILVILALACYLAVSTVLPGHDQGWAGLLMAWCWYSCVVSMLVILGNSRLLLTILGLAVPIVALALILNHRTATAIVVSVAVLVLASVTVVLVMHLRTSSDRRLFGHGGWSAAVAPAAQASFLAAALSLALTRLPDWEGTALIVATVVAAAATDPALVLMRQRLVWSSNRTPLLRHAARNARSLTMTMSAAIVVISASVSTLVVVFLVEDTRVATTVLVAAAFSSLATTSTTLAAFGLPGGGVVFAGAAFFSAEAWIAAGNTAGILVAAAFLVAGIGVLLSRVSDPRTYA